MTDQPLNVLFLCTGNSCRSVIGEGLLNQLGAGRYAAYSAGSNPVGEVNPEALAVLERHGCPTRGLYSKDVDEFLAPDAPRLDLVFTVCDNAAAACPLWPGDTLVVHWGLPDPAHVDGSRAVVEAAFDQTFEALRERIEGLLGLEPRAMTPDALAEALAAFARLPLPGQAR
jgi:protein-tyrosine-phosphatase